jgi:2-methylcitrate dehydratase PrpD
VVSILKRIVLDPLGVTLAAGTLGEGVRSLVETARSAGGAPESTLIGFGEKVPAIMAALVNGGMAQALNYADTAELGGHLGPASVPAALAVAERAGGVSGKEFLAALTAGAELQSRISRAFKLASGDRPVKPLRTQLWGYFSAAASAGRVLKLSADEMHSALGLALMQASGTMQVVRGGDPPAKAIYAAFPNHGGVLSALLSKQGLGARFSQLFEGEAGLFALYHEGRFAPGVMEANLGETFHLSGVRFKPWPFSGVVHSLVDAALQLVSRETIDAASIERVLLRGGPDIRHCAEPAELRKKPGTATAAANSVFFPIAKVLANGRLVLDDFTPTGLHQPEVLRLAERIDCSTEADLGGSGIVEVAMTGGQRHASRVDKPLGHLSRPMSYGQLVEKFLDCARHAPRPLSLTRLQEVIEMADSLEQLPDVAALARLLAGDG